MEKLIRNYCCSNGVKARILRLAEIGGIKNSDQKNVLTKSITQLLQKGSITIDSNKYETLDGTCTRNYIHIDDVCNLLIKILCNWSPRQGSCPIYDVGGTDNLSTLQLVTRVLNLHPGYVCSGQGGLRIGHVKNPTCPVLIPDMQKACSAYDWQPTELLDKIITDTITENL